ncbi:Thiosulfate sulfurtransferase GlpE [subsurface metagenome]|jgi:rhodanese-related sulfurtransferase
MSLKDLIVLALSVSLVIGVALTGGCVRDETATIEDITPQEAFTLIQNNQNNPDFIIIDVRTLEEFVGEHIENATNIDFYSEAFRDMLNTLDKNKTYLIYCKVGGRSGSALDIMAELNFKEVYNILGGINQWKAEGLPTVK